MTIEQAKQIKASIQAENNDSLVNRAMIKKLDDIIENGPQHREAKEPVRSKPFRIQFQIA